MKDPVFLPAPILLPKAGTDLSRWAVLACDQFTSEVDYWQQAQQYVGDAPSTLRIILPEVYLEEPDVQARVAAIHQAMDAYATDVLHPAAQGFVYVERQTEAGVRCGLVGCVDLEAYDYKQGSSPRIRPSESTVEARIPPRLAVRRGAKLESPHILMLIDDVAGTVIEPLAAGKQRLAPLYDVQLMLGGGRLRGWAVTDPALGQKVQNAVAALEDENAFYARYPGARGVTTPFALAVGDGNHSLATAKAAWEEVKAGLNAEEQKTHPARFCLVELENVRSSAIAMEPIHRVVFGPSGEEVLTAITYYAAQHGLEMPRSGGEQHFSLLYRNNCVEIHLGNTREPLTVGTVDAILALCQASHPGLRIDYVHGEDSVAQLVAKGAVGLLLPPFEKADLFRGVALGGVLPRKTFSMGHAREKRYYMECRKIVP